MYAHAYIHRVFTGVHMSSVLDNEEIPKWIFFGQYG